MYMYLYMYLYMYMYYMYTHIFASISICLSCSLYNYDKYVCIYDNMERRQFMVTFMRIKPLASSGSAGLKCY